jgi:hypothetical protein
MSAMTVHVDINPRSVWEVDVPDRPGRVVCESFDDAKRVAHLCAQHRHPCELIVRDAYHRVLIRELIGSAGGVNSHGRDEQSEWS